VELDINTILTERGNRYNLNGTYYDHGYTVQKMKDAMREHKGWDKLPPDMRETLDMVQHKIGRILNGDPFYLDNWDDIVGYVTLVTRTFRDAVTDKVGE
jgi:hypothetical protein